MAGIIGERSVHREAIPAEVREGGLIAEGDVGQPIFTAGYDGDDLRVSKSDGGSATVYYLDDEAGSPVMELDSSGNVLDMNGYGPTGWVAHDYPGGPSTSLAGQLAAYYGAQDYSYTYDPEGNLVQRHPAVSFGWDAMDTSLYSAYGSLISDTDAVKGGSEQLADPVGFGGQYGYYFDQETGKSLLGHRYYDSAYGRFLNRDPIGYNGGINLYGYVGNNPINRSDPSGFQTPVYDPDYDPFIRIANGFDNMTASDWENALLHNDATNAIETVADWATNIPDPEDPVFDVKAGEEAVRLGGEVAGDAVDAGRALVTQATEFAREGEDLFVGTYRESRAANRMSGLNATYTPHHAVQDAVSEVSQGDGVTINLERSIHVQTRTFRRQARVLPSLRQHLAADVSELRNLLRNSGYARSRANRQLQELVRQNKANGGFGK